VSLRFGTDGIRGVARSELTVDAVAALGQAGAEILGAGGFAVGRDTRESGADLSTALHQGIAAAGGSPVDLGVVPTPAVARWCADERVAGAMVSASHNSWSDNGVKLFAVGGLKLADAIQDRIQLRFDELQTAGSVPVPLLGPIDRRALASERHIEAVIASLDGRDLHGLRIVVDAANGAASASAPDALDRLGADVIALHTDPDGRNINVACGSTHPEALQAEVLARRADMGVAFDGDADRMLAVDADGSLVDGDHIIAICAIDRHRRGALTGSAVVVTVMTNLGFRRSMAERGIEVFDTAVGDRHVLEALDRRHLDLGGEQSGHVIFRDLATTGDGMLTAVQLADVVARSGLTLAGLAAESMRRLPQELRSVTLATRSDDLMDTIGPLVAAAESRVGDHGRVLVRPSGTEPLVRVMVEADDDETAHREADRLVSEISDLVN
jgi:phosphoglucosamine mutase